MSRRRLILLVGPPAVALSLAVTATATPGHLAGARGTSLAPPGEVAPCDDGPVAVLSATSTDGVGAWWRTDPELDDAGALEGWRLELGGPGRRRSVLELPPGATVTGPRDGLVVVAVEDPDALGTAGVRVIDAVAGCAAVLDVPDRVVRRAVPDPAGVAVLAHLLNRRTRADLGVWRLFPDGRRAERVLEPPGAGRLAEAGITTVWATMLATDETRLAVASCDPDACLIRVVDLATRRELDRAGDPGPGGQLIGFAKSGEVVAWDACHAGPCRILGWDPGRGTSRVLAVDAFGAAVSGDGRTLVSATGEPGARELVAADLDAAREDPRHVAWLGDESLPIPVAAETTGYESGDRAIAIGAGGRVPVPVALDDDAGSNPPPAVPLEVQP